MLAVACVSGQAFGQAPAAAPAMTPTPTPTPTIKANAQLVVVDVVVTDKSGRPVHGLTQNDFKLLEGNAPQTVRHFEEHSTLTPVDSAQAAAMAMPKLPPGEFTNFSPAPERGAINLLLLDALNTPMKDQAYVRQQLLNYIKTVPPGTRIAIFGLTSKLTVLQSFTGDPEVLKTVLAKGITKSSPLLDDAAGVGGTSNSISDDMEDMGMDASTVANVREFEAMQSSFQIQLRAKYTLDAMNDIARYLAAMPGRKNLIWFSGSFPINILPDTTGNLPDPFAAMADSEQEFRDTVALLARSQVAVYPIDARGLMTPPAFDASSSRNYGGARGATRFSQDLNKFSNDQTQEHGTMTDMAQATGGRAFVNTNDLTKAVATAIDEGSNYYTLTYTPANYVPDGKLHKIKIDVARPGVQLAYRHGYYADDPNGGKMPYSGMRDSAVTKTGGPTSADSMHMAMTRGAPAPTEIIMRVGVYPAGGPGKTEDKVAASNQPSPKAKGPFVRYDVQYAINPADIAFLKTADGKVKADFDLVIFVFDPDGVMVNSLAQGIHVAAPIETIRKSIVGGIHCAEQISAPAKGEYFLRIAVHDLNRDHYGAVEVATSQVRNLTPPALPPVPAAPAAAK
jgi:VWFA-related protein